MAGDILLDMLAEAPPRETGLCARRLADKPEAPRRLLRFLASREIDIARPLLEENEGFDVSDLIRVAMAGSLDHRLLIARRKTVDSMLCERLLEFEEVSVARALVTNRGAVLSDASLDLLMTLSRDYVELARLLMDREELGPAHALAMFWWSDAPTRRAILQRQAAERADLIANCEDIFPIAAREGWSDPVARKALQLIERRQRNRAAIERSPYDSLEHAIDVAERDGLAPKLAQEIGYLAGVKPVTVAKILSDPGGEGVAVLCKATGLKTPAMRALWAAMRRPVTAEDGSDHPQFAALEVVERRQGADHAALLELVINGRLLAHRTGRRRRGRRCRPAGRNVRTATNRKTGLRQLRTRKLRDGGLVKPDSRG